MTTCVIAMLSAASQPAGAWHVNSIDAPGLNATTHVLTSNLVTNPDPTACTYAFDPCVGGELEVDVLLDGRWTPLGSTTAPNGGPSADQAHLKWFATGTCVSGIDDPLRQYRSFFSQKFRDQGGLVLTESFTATASYRCTV
jgi:hypothetical protein